MVIVKIMGGLGNQMFQYALARKLEVLGRKVILETSYFSDIPEGDSLRINRVPQFKHKFREIKEENKVCSKRNLSYLYSRLMGDSYKIVEQDFKYDPDILKQRYSYLIGYWQTDRYFRDIEELLRSDFQFNPVQLSEKETAIYQELMHTPNSVSIHIRMGDYLKKENYYKFGNICNLNYYNNACKLCETRLGKCKFYVFTDDPANFEKEIRLERDYKVISDDYMSDWSEMFLMSCCKNNIIANSTFSWWASWLNVNSEKLVIAPQRWVNGEDREDIFCDNWIRVSGEPEVLM